MKRKNIEVKWVQIEPPAPQPRAELSSVECFNLAEAAQKIHRDDWAEHWLDAAVVAEARERQQGLVAV